MPQTSQECQLVGSLFADRCSKLCLSYCARYSLDSLTNLEASNVDFVIQARSKGLLLPNLKVESTDEKFEGAIVIEPKKGFYR